jgi:isomerase DpgB
MMKLPSTSLISEQVDPYKTAGIGEPNPDRLERSAIEIFLGCDTDLSMATDQLNGLSSGPAGTLQPPHVLIRLNTTTTTAFFDGMLATQTVNRWERAVRRLERLNTVTMVVASGACGGVALDLILACDYRIAVQDFRLLLPVHQGCFWPGMGLYRLVQQAGLIQARRLLLTGRELSLECCLRMGLIDVVENQSAGAIDTQIHGMNHPSGEDLAIRRQLLTEALSTPYEEAIGTHLAACDRELRRIRELHDV